MSKLRIAFSGIGAVGGYYGGILTSRYQKTDKADIFFIARGENLRAIQEDGLYIKMYSGRIIHTNPTLVTDNPENIGGPVDYLFCCTKSYDLEENITQLSPIIDPKTVIIPLLNGLDITERIQKILPKQTIWKGCVYIGARLTHPGFVEKFTAKDQLFFGNGLSNDPKGLQEKLLQFFSAAKVSAFNPPDIDIRIWKKYLAISVAATTTSFFNQNIDEVVKQHSDLFIALGYELKSIANAKGVQLPDDIIHTILETQKLLPTGSTTSMHADFLNGKRTEIESLTGHVIRMAEELGIEVPTYQFMYNGLTKLPYSIKKE